MIKLELSDTYGLCLLAYDGALSRKQRIEIIQSLTPAGQRVARRWLKRNDDTRYNSQKYKEAQRIFPI